MTVTESERRHLQEALVQKLGAPAADTLMAHLPPVGWADVATKADLETLHTVLRSDMNAVEERLRREIGQLGIELNDKLRAQLYWMMTLMVVLLGAFGTVIKVG